MTQISYFKSKIFNIRNQADFDVLAIALFQYQAQHNVVYKRYLDLLSVDYSEIKKVSEIPFLPISCFKNFEVKTENYIAEEVFSSSGTTGTQRSKHYVADVEVYKNSFNKAFSHLYSLPKNYCTLALLPSYLERKGSSLVYMVQDFVAQSLDNDSDFYLDNLESLAAVLKQKQQQKIPTLLLGVSFALLDLAEAFPQNLSHITIMETGGMKGKRKEMIRSELHAVLKEAFKVSQIHSEYGMTELLSQAYAAENGCFKTPPWMQVSTREITDPFTVCKHGKTGGINIIDLANISSCAFIETQDLGRSFANGTFEVMGRFDHSEIRGCNLMIQ